MDCQTGAFRHALSIIIVFKKKKKKEKGKRKLIKSRFPKSCILLLNLRHLAMPYPLFPEQVKITHSFSKKKETFFFSKNEGLSCIKLSNQGHLAMPHSSKCKSYQKWIDKFKLFTTRLHQVNSKLVSSKVSTRS